MVRIHLIGGTSGLTDLEVEELESGLGFKLAGSHRYLLKKMGQVRTQLQSEYGLALELQKDFPKEFWDYVDHDFELDYNNPRPVETVWPPFCMLYSLDYIEWEFYLLGDDPDPVVYNWHGSKYSYEYISTHKRYSEWVVAQAKLLYYIKD